MGNITIMIGAGLVAFLFLYMLFKLGERGQETGDKHFLLQLLLLFFVASLIVIIGKTALDDKDFCAWNVENATNTGSTTQYDYGYHCETNTNSTVRTFYNITLGFFTVLSLYIFGYFVYEVLKYLGWVVGGNK